MTTKEAVKADKEENADIQVAVPVSEKAEDSLTSM